jgi:hypothetical protein
MKKNVLFVGMLAMALVFGLVFTACPIDSGDDDDDSSDSNPTVTGVTVNAAGNASSVAKGETLQFTANVTGINNPAQTVTWTINTTGIASGTTISAGLLTVAAGETQTAIEVKATSTVDPTKSGTRTVTVTASSGDPVLSGSIHITVVKNNFVDPTEIITEATIGEFDFLAATYSGWETVTYQWKKDGVDLLYPGEASNISVNSPGVYTVTVSAEGYQSKTSDPVNVTDGSSGDPDRAAVPTASPGTGTYPSAQNVTLSCATGGAVIHYTLDGSAPTAGSAVYSSPITISATTTLKAIAVKTGMTNSDVLTVVYTISGGGGGGDETPNIERPPASWTNISWGTTGFGANASIYSVAYGNGRWVTVGRVSTNNRQGGLGAWSDDGETWTKITTGFTNRPSSTFNTTINSVAYGDNRWVAVGNDGIAAWSDDGKTWTSITGFGDDDDLSSVAYGNGRWVAAGSRSKAFWSDDGKTWTAIENTTLGSASINSVAWGNNRWVMVTGSGTGAWSADGKTWTTIGNTTFRSDNSYTSISSVAYGKGRWVIAGGSGTGAYSDNNGITWTSVTFNSQDNAISSVAYGKGRWVAGGARFLAWSDDNGETWTTASVHPFGGVYNAATSIAYGNGRWLAVGVTYSTNIGVGAWVDD